MTFFYLGNSNGSPADMMTEIKEAIEKGMENIKKPADMISNILKPNKKLSTESMEGLQPFSSS